MVENARLKFYHERLRSRYGSKTIWKELKNRDICSYGLDATLAFTSDELNRHFSGITFNALGPSVDDLT